MNFEIRGNEGTGLWISINSEEDTSCSELREQQLVRNGAELNSYSFDGVHITLIKVEQGILHVENRISEPFVTAYGILSGELKSENSTGEITLLQLNAGQHNLYYPAPLIPSFQIEAPFQAFILHFPEAYLCRMLADDGGIASFLLKHIHSKKAFITSTLPVNPRVHHLVNTLQHAGPSGSIKRILLEAKVLELLSSQLEQLEQAYHQSSGSSFLKAHDIDKIFSAKSIIEQNIQTPCSLIELSRKVGLNDFKLKKGFKEILGTTVFSYLSDFRMERAKVLLEQKKSVSEVAYEVGYKNPHHFTVAFKKKFGFLPSGINK
jgi:AraC-like DNA-binding protein